MESKNTKEVRIEDYLLEKAEEEGLRLPADTDMFLKLMKKLEKEAPADKHRKKVKSEGTKL